MAQDPYSVLGVGRQAGAEEIRKAYRRLAKTYHPDYNAGDKKAEDRFKAISAAYDIIGDPEKKKRFDRGEIDAEGHERATMGRGAGGASRSWSSRSSTGPGETGFDDLSDIFGEFFGGRSSAGRRPPPRKGPDTRYRLAIDFLDAARGVTKRVALSDGRGLDVVIPEGIRDGQTLRLKGQGTPGTGGGQPGDVLVEVSVTPHPVFTLDGDDLRLDVPITLREAVLGGKIDIPTLNGPVAIRIPPNTSSGVVFRLKDKGLKHRKEKTRGELSARVKIMLPKSVDHDLEAFIATWDGGGDDVRAALREAVR